MAYIHPVSSSNLDYPTIKTMIDFFTNMNDFGALNLFKFRHVLTPIAIDYAKHIKSGKRFEQTIELSYNSIYIFGIRIARWRAD